MTTLIENAGIRVNPLTRHFRQPGLDVTLPTKGIYLDPGAVQEDGSVSIFPMTAGDELLLKHPDMLLSGHAIEQLLKSCVPSIADPGKISSPDLDVLLLAIRAATYGDVMEVQADCPECEAENSFDVNLPSILQSAKPIEEEDTILRLSDEVVVYIRPYNFRDATRISIATFNETRKVQSAEDDSENRMRQMNASMDVMTKLTVAIMASCVVKITVPEGDVTEPEYIAEFMSNTTRGWSSKIETKLTDLNARGIDKSVHASCINCKHEWATSIEFDPASFFRLRLLKTRTYEDVQALISEYRVERRELHRHLVSILWHMRGGLSREEAWHLCPTERADIMQFIEERMRIVEKTRLPLI